MKGELTESVAKGVTWTGISQFSVQGFQFAVTVILARLLVPEHFGIVGMAAIFKGLVTMVNTLGLNAAIVQRKEITEKHLSTAFWIGIATGIVLCIITVICSPFVAGFFDNQLVRPVLSAISIAFILGSLGMVHGALLARNMDFRKLAICAIGGTAVSGIASVSLAFAGFGVWSLVCGQLLNSLICAALVWFVCPWRPSLMFSFTGFRELFRFGISIIGINFVGYARMNMDYLIVGRLLGASSLGLYTFAYNLITLPQRKLSTIVTRVTFPAFSKIQDEDKRLCRAYLRVISYISLVTFPLLAGLLCVAPEFVLTVYGEKWAAIVLPAQIMCVSGMLISIGAAAGSVFCSKGRPDLELKVDVAMLLTFPFFLIMGIRYGLVGIAVAVTVFYILTIPINPMVFRSLIGLRFRDYFLSLYPATLGSTVMALALFCYRYAQQAVLDLPNPIFLASSVSIGVLVYFLTLKAARVKALGEILEIALSIVRPFTKSIARKIIPNRQASA